MTIARKVTFVLTTIAVGGLMILSAGCRDHHKRHIRTRGAHHPPSPHVRRKHPPSPSPHGHKSGWKHKPPKGKQPPPPHKKKVVVKHKKHHAPPPSKAQPPKNKPNRGKPSGHGKHHKHHQSHPKP